MIDISAQCGTGESPGDWCQGGNGLYGVKLADCSCSADASTTTCDQFVQFDFGEGSNQTLTQVYPFTSTEYGQMTSPGWNEFLHIVTDEVRSVRGNNQWNCAVGNTTGDTNDRYLLVNGSTNVGEVFRMENIGVIAGNSYEFGLDRMEVCLNYKVNPPVGCIHKHDIRVQILDGSNGSILTNIDWGEPSDWCQWQMETGTFTAPTSGNITLVLLEEKQESIGTDFVVDNIYFRTSSASCPTCLVGGYCVASSGDAGVFNNSCVCVCDVNNPDGDCDSDGVRNGIDCDPSDPAINYAPRFLCDDGDNTTLRDAIDNSCNCVGVAFNSLCTDPDYYADDCDYDGDGIPNINDRDDDNDGILDIDECPGPLTADLFEQLVNGSKITVVEGGASGSPVVNDAGPNNDQVGLRYIDQGSFTTYYRIDISNFDYSTFDGSFLSFNIFIKATGGTWFTSNPSVTDVDIRLIGGGEMLIGNISDDPFSATKPADGSYDVSFQINDANFTGTQANLDNALNNLQYIDIRAEFWTGGTLESELIPLEQNQDASCLDTDSDGIPDKFDSDSDDDGCPDAIEAGGNYIAFQMALNTNINAAGGPQIQLGAITDVDGNGVPNIASGGQSLGSATRDGTPGSSCTQGSILAVDDTRVGRAGEIMDSVYDNDEANASAATDATVTTPLVISDGGLTGLDFESDGTFIVPSFTSNGTYTIEYEICLDSYPNICDRAKVTLTIDNQTGNYSIGANSDIFSALPGDPITSILDNDVANGVMADDASVTTPTVLNDGGLSGFSINSDGTANVPPGATPGEYTIQYQICLELENSYCSEANIVLTVLNPCELSGTLTVKGVDPTTCGGNDGYLEILGLNMGSLPSVNASWTGISPELATGLSQSGSALIISTRTAGEYNNLRIVDPNDPSCYVDVTGNH